MKMRVLVFATLGVVFALPAVVCLVDAWSWLVFGEQISWMQWNGWRLMLAGLFMIPAAAMATAILGSFDAADR